VAKKGAAQGIVGAAEVGVIEELGSETKPIFSMGQNRS